jgi:hypothetical protein
MDPILVELAKWVPAPLVLYIAYALARREVTRLLSELALVKEMVGKALAEAEKRVTVADHRESMKGIWDSHRALEREFIDFRASTRSSPKRGR